jgi:hypothetical protein
MRSVYVRGRVGVEWRTWVIRVVWQYKMYKMYKEYSVYS